MVLGQKTLRVCESDQEPLLSQGLHTAGTHKMLSRWMEGELTTRDMGWWLAAGEWLAEWRDGKEDGRMVRKHGAQVAGWVAAVA